MAIAMLVGALIIAPVVEKIEAGQRHEYRCRTLAVQVADAVLLAQPASLLPSSPVLRARLSASNSSLGHVFLAQDCSISYVKEEARRRLQRP